MTVEEELALVIRVQSGERDALNTLWEAITPKLYGYLLNTLRDGHAAEDTLQETWLKAIKALPQFRIRDVRLSAWIFAIARNECRQHWRKNNYELLHTDTENEIDIAAPTSNPDEKLLVESVLHRLSSDDQDILRLRYLADLSFKDVAAVLGISIITARVRVHRALHRARPFLIH